MFYGFHHDLWPVKVIWGPKKLYHSKAHIYLPIWLLWTPSLHLVPFSKYSTSKFPGFDLDLWSLEVIWSPKKNLPFESPYMTSYLTSMDSICLSRTVFEIFDFKVFRVWLWPMTPKVLLGSEIHTGRKPIYDFLFDFYGQHLSISYRFRDIRLQSF